MRHGICQWILAGAVLLAGAFPAGAATNAAGPPAPPLPPAPPVMPPRLPPQTRSAQAGPVFYPALQPVAPSAVVTPPVAPPPPALPGVPRALPPPAPRVVTPFPLAFDADLQQATVGADSTSASFKFSFTNTSAEAVTLDRVQTSCGCTTTRLPVLPWVLAPGTNGSFEVVLDVRGKRGQVNKMVYLFTNKGFKALTVCATVPDTQGTPLADRLRNLQVAAADRQAVFRGECASCHAEPAKGRMSRELFNAVCGICHEAEHRAEMVPDLALLKHPTGPDHWRQWISFGKASTLMPAFAQSEGGPLTPEQVESLVNYLVLRFPPRPAGLPPVVAE